MPELPFDSEITIVGLITFGLAVLGAGLGIFNAWFTFNQTRLRMKVTPVHAFVSGEPRAMFGIKVINLSQFPVTVSELGMTLDGRRIAKDGRFVISQPIITDGGSFPRRLEPRTSFTGYFYLSNLGFNAGRLGRAYAQTECLTTRYGNSGALKQIKDEANRPSQ